MRRHARLRELAVGNKIGVLHKIFRFAVAAQAEAQEHRSPIQEHGVLTTKRRTERCGVSFLNRSEEVGKWEWRGHAPANFHGRQEILPVDARRVKFSTARTLFATTT